MTTATREPSVQPERQTIASRRFAMSSEVSERFFAANAESIAHACQAMAKRFQQEGRLLIAGDGAQRSDVAHAVVEFVHPVVVGKRALPALALPGATDDGVLRALATLGRVGDIVMLLDARPACEADLRLLARANDAGMLTLALTGPACADTVGAADFHFAVESHDPCIVQETHEMLYHVLWELVHVFFEHRGVSA